MSGSRIMWVLWFLLNVTLITCKGELKYISSFCDYKVSYHNLASATIYRRRCQMNVAANRKRKIMSRYELFMIFLWSPAQFPAALQGSSPNRVCNKEQLQKIVHKTNSAAKFHWRKTINVLYSKVRICCWEIFLSYQTRRRKRLSHVPCLDF